MTSWHVTYDTMAHDFMISWHMTYDIMARDIMAHDIMAQDGAAEGLAQGPEHGHSTSICGPRWGRLE